MPPEPLCFALPWSCPSSSAPKWLTPKSSASRTISSSTTRAEFRQAPRRRRSRFRTCRLASTTGLRIGPDGANVVTLTIDPIVPTIAFAGTTGSGVLKTTDGGASWAPANAGLATTNVLALAIDAATPSTLYAGTDAGVFKSTDGGQSWAAANGGMDGAPSIVVNALAIDPSSPTTLYAGTSAGVFKTTNGAASWTSINTGLSGLAARVITIDPTAPSTVYIAVDDNVSYVNYGVFKSTNGGTTWAKIYTTPLGEDGGAPPVTALAIDPRSPSRLYLVVAFNQVLTSSDGGSWSDLKAPAHDVWSLAVDPSSPATIYVGTYSGLIFRTTDGGSHWASVSDGLAASGVNVIATAAPAPGIVLRRRPQRGLSQLGQCANLGALDVGD